MCRSAATLLGGKETAAIAAEIMKHAPIARMPLEQLEVFFGRATPAEARIYARIPAVGLPAGARLTGSVRGPKSAFSHTLSATIPLVDLGPGAARVAEAVVPEPCFWTPGMPYLYEVRVSLEVGGQAWAQSEQMLGIRPMGSSHRRLVLEGKPWILRTVEPSDFTIESLIPWREAKASLVLSHPGDAECRAASEQGVGLVAMVNEGDIAAELRRLSRWPAVMLAVVPADFDPGQVPPPANLMLGVRMPLGKPPAWAKVVLAEPTGNSSEDWRGQVGADVSLIAVKTTEDERTVQSAAQSLAEFEGAFAAGEWAGYALLGK